MTSEAKSQIEIVNTQIHEIENNLTIINSQKIELEKAIGELKKAIEVSERLDRLVGQLGGTEQLQQYLAKLEGFNFEELDQVFKKVAQLSFQGAN